MADQDEGTKFLALLKELRERTGDSPDMLASGWKDDDRLQFLCDQLYALIREFRIVEDWSEHPFTHNVPVAAAQARRDFETRWSGIVGEVANREMHVFFEQILASLKREPDETEPDDASVDELGNQIADWKETAKEEAARIEQMIDHAFQEREDDIHGSFEWVTESLWAWDRLIKVSGLDMEGALWRRRAVPHILVPSHVAKQYGAERASLYRRLDQAAKAFIFGAPLAALALQRAVLEEVLRKHWGATERMIESANLPDLTWDARANRLKRLANDALHNDPDKLKGEALDRAVIENFLLLRLLIEGAPPTAEPSGAVPRN